MSDLCAAKRECQGTAVALKWAAVSRTVDQSQTRNKRNDQLAEGHACVAGADVVLRSF
jgi:hypothetical protein